MSTQPQTFEEAWANLRCALFHAGAELVAPVVRRISWLSFKQCPVCGGRGPRPALDTDD